MAEPIPLHKARKRKPAAPPPDADDAPCPLTALGHVDGKFYFMNIVGEKRGLTARQLGARAEIAALFLGDMDWLKARFPQRDDEGRVTGFRVNKTSEFLMDACRRQGIYGDHVIIRRPGVWAGEAGMPIAHCGDAVFMDGEKHPPGQKLAGQIFAAGAREIYPANAPAPAATAHELQSDIADLWRFRHDGSELIVLGLIGQGYLAAALSWRANGFIMGGSNAGKSTLLNLMRAATPLSHYSTDTSKAGIEGAINGRAVPSFLDETSERADGQGAQLLLDVVLSAAGGEGTKKHRGTADGGVRSIEMVGSVVMASINPPPMQPQHRSRFVLVDLLSPEKGADHTAPMAAAIARAKAAAPGLFARALAAFARYRLALGAFRASLGQAGCVAREMDQMGAILAGWWILVEDGVPDAAAAASSVKTISAFIRGADEMVEDSAPQQVLALLLSKVVALDRSTDQESIARLFSHALSESFDMGISAQREQAVKVLERWGMRPIRVNDVEDRSHRPMPRLGEGNGIWMDPRVQPLRGIFRDTAYDGDRWIFELLRLKSARRSPKAVRIGAMTPCKAIWISYDEINDVSDTG